jgi:hypothetical protein
MSAFGGKADMTVCGNTLLQSLLGVKRTCVFALHMSAFDPMRTLGPSDVRVIEGKNKNATSISDQSWRSFNVGQKNGVKTSKALADLNKSAFREMRCVTSLALIGR